MILFFYKNFLQLMLLTSEFLLLKKKKIEFSFIGGHIGGCFSFSPHLAFLKQEIVHQ